MTVDASDVDLIACLLLQTSLTAVGHGLVERLEVFERRFWFVRRGCAEVFVEEAVARTPSNKILCANFLREIFAK